MGLFDPTEPIGPDLVAMLYARCDGKCTSCGEPLGDDRNNHAIHHRNRYPVGSTVRRPNNLANLIMMHNFPCHIDHVHGHPEWARARGLIVATTDDPAEVPLILPGVVMGGNVVMLSDDYHQYDPTGRWDFDTPKAP